MLRRPLCLLLFFFAVILCLCFLAYSHLKWKPIQDNLPNQPDEQPVVVEKAPSTVRTPPSKMDLLIDSLARLESKHLNWHEHNHMVHLAAALKKKRIHFYTPHKIIK